MKYYIYQNDKKVQEVDGKKTVTITGLAANTKYTQARQSSSRTEITM